ncbi:MAG: hypothetical protein ABEJ03_02310 [Candidatus Nanohaloarchaea archaeon]
MHTHELEFRHAEVRGPRETPDSVEDYTHKISVLLRSRSKYSDVEGLDEQFDDQLPGHKIGGEVEVGEEYCFKLSYENSTFSVNLYLPDDETAWLRYDEEEIDGSELRSMLSEKD